jgi:hypothetical protein
MNYWKGGETYHIIEAIKAHPRLVDHWKVSVAEWARMNRTDPNAAAVLAWLPLWQSREIYSAEELAPIWPALSIATGFTKYWPSVLKSPARLEFELEFHGLPVRVIDGRKYFAIDRRGYWRDAETELWIKEIARENENAQR